MTFQKERCRLLAKEERQEQQRAKEQQAKEQQAKEQAEVG
jgi:hypothetical protein